MWRINLLVLLFLLWVGPSHAATVTNIANGVLQSPQGEFDVNMATLVFAPGETVPCHQHIDIGLKLVGTGGVDGFVTVTAGELAVTQKGITTTYTTGMVIPEPTSHGLSHKAIAGADGATVVIWRAKPVDEIGYRVLVDDLLCERGGE